MEENPGGHGRCPRYDVVRRHARARNLHVCSRTESRSLVHRAHHGNTYCNTSHPLLLNSCTLCKHISYFPQPFVVSSSGVQVIAKTCRRLYYQPSGSACQLVRWLVAGYVRFYCTVSCVVPEMPPEVAVIVVVPVVIADTNPDDEMVATEVLLEVQVTLVVTSPVVPSENVAVAVNCCEVPLVMVGFCGLMVMLVMVLLLTLSPVAAITLPD